MAEFSWKLSPRLEKSFQDYAASHVTKGNQNTHKMGIPMILLSLFFFARWIPSPPPVEGPFLFWIVLTFLYVTLDKKWGALFSLVLLAFYALSFQLTPPIAWIFFAVGWAFQLIGHFRYEKNSPAFFKSLEHLLIGPLWIFYKMLRPRK